MPDADPALQPHFRMIAAAEAEALLALSAGATFSELCWMAVLTSWIEDGLIVSIG